ncbi:hypothetical protein BH24DEI2_BH24DEI2_16880 [soil metagenome]
MACQNNQMNAFVPPHDPPTGVFRMLGLTNRSHDLIKVVKNGLSVQVFCALAEKLEVSEAALANLAGISSTTLTHRKRTGQLTPDESEHVLRIANFLERAAQVFESVTDAAAWLKTPNLSLGNATPLEYADTEIGAREVENLLGRVDYGVYS